MMYRNRFLLVSAIAAVVFLFLPVTTLLARLQVQDGPIVPEDPRALWSVNNAEGMLALGLWSCCSVSLDTDQVVIGQSGYLFLGNGHNRVIDRTSGRKMPDARAVEGWADHMWQLSDWLQARGSDFLLVIAPNKHTIYPEFLPPEVAPADITGTDMFIEAAREQNLPLLDLRTPMTGLKASAQAYLKTDTHWTNLGAARGYEATLEALGPDYDRIAYTAEELEHTSGDLANLLKVRDLLGHRHETDYAIGFENLVVCAGATPFIGSVPDICTAEAGDGGGFETTFAPAAINPGTALLICDSFCEANIALYRSTFRIVHKVQWQDLLDRNMAEQIDRLQPDVVIFQLVERNLFEPRLHLQ